MDICQHFLSKKKDLHLHTLPLKQEEKNQTI